MPTDDKKVCDDRKNKGDDIQPDTRLEDIEWRVRTTTGGWRNRSRRVEYTLNDNALASLKADGIETVADLRGQSEETLKSYAGVGKKAAERLVLAMNQANVWYEGIGYPHEISVTVQVPDDAVPIVDGYDQQEVELVLRQELESRDFFAEVGERIVERRVSQLESKRDELEKRIRDLRKQT